MEQLRKLLDFSATLLVVGFLTMGSVLVAQHDPQSDTASSLTSTDKHFVLDAAEGGLAEVELGQLAEGKASSQKVKDFGRKMAEDHGKANQDLKDCAQKVGVSVPDQLSATQMAQKVKLSAYSGEHFDRAYMADMLKDHREDIAAFKREAASGQDPDIRAFASKTVPTLKSTYTLRSGWERKLSGVGQGSRTR